MNALTIISMRSVFLAIGLCLATSSSVLARESKGSHISTGIVFPSSSDAVRYSAATIPMQERSSIEAIGGLPIGDSDEIRAIASALGTTPNFGGGVAMEYWNPTIAWRGGAGVQFKAGPSQLALGVSGSLISSLWSLSPSIALDWSSVRFAVVLNNIDDGFDIVTFGAGLSNSFLRLEVDFQRGFASDFGNYLMPALGLRFEPITVVGRYYLYSDENSWVGGEFGAGAALDLGKHFVIEALYRYDPSEFNVGVKFMF